jgi:hypothetical protein
MGSGKRSGVGSVSQGGCLTIPVGGSPTGTGESPVPPILKTRPNPYHHRNRNRNLFGPAIKIKNRITIATKRACVKNKMSKKPTLTN